MSDPILCPLCGVKLRRGWKRCPNCRELLPADSPAATPAARVTRFTRVQVLAAGGGLAALVVLALAIPARRQPAAPQTAPPAAPQPAVTQTPRRAEPGRQALEVLTAPAAIDSLRTGNVAYKQGDLAGALQSYAKAVTANPEDAESLNNLAQILARTNRAGEAIDYLERAIRLNPNRWAYHFNLAHALGQLGQWERAIAEYRVADQLFPDDHVTLYNLAMALHKTGDEKAAVEQHLKAIAQAPDEPTFHLSLGISYERLQLAADAVRAYRRYLALAPNASDAPQVRARVDALAGWQPREASGAVSSRPRG